MKNEFIRVLVLNVEFLEGLWRKIRQIARDDHAGTALDWGRQHVAIIPVWQPKFFNQMLVSSHEDVRRGLVRQLPGALQLFAGEVGAVRQ
jgi:hypothetical protein